MEWKYLPLVILTAPIAKVVADKPTTSDYVVTVIVIAMVVSLLVALRKP